MSQLTIKGLEPINVIVQDIVTKEELYRMDISRARLAKLFFENRVIGAKLGLFVIED